MITYTCDAAGCGATSTSQLPEIAGKHLCPRCARGLKLHIVDWLADKAIQAKVREDQDKIDAEHVQRQEDEEKAKEEGLEGQIANRIATKLKLPLDTVLARLRKVKADNQTSTIQASRDLLQMIANENEEKKKAEEAAAKIAKKTAGDAPKDAQKPS